MLCVCVCVCVCVFLSLWVYLCACVRVLALSSFFLCFAFSTSLLDAESQKFVISFKRRNNLFITIKINCKTVKRMTGTSQSISGYSARILDEHKSLCDWWASFIWYQERRLSSFYFFGFCSITSSWSLSLFSSSYFLDTLSIFFLLMSILWD